MGCGFSKSADAQIPPGASTDDNKENLKERMARLSQAGGALKQLDSLVPELKGEFARRGMANEAANNTAPPPPSKLKVALDWTPNSNHAGMYVALHEGLYAAEGLDVQILPPSAEYTMDETPARSVVNGRADLCVCPSESMISCLTSDKSAESLPMCVATLLQQDSSAIACKASLGITSPAQLSGRTYASYEGRFEMNIVNEIVKLAGGDGPVVETTPSKLQIFDKLLAGDADAEATWIFDAWEGIMAKRSGVALQSFPLKSSGVPYGYSPCLLASRALCLADGGENLRKFLAATEKGYQISVADPARAADALLASNHPSLVPLGRDFLVESLTFLGEGQFFLDSGSASGQWGRMDAQRWQAFVSWLLERRLVARRNGEVVTALELDAEKLYTNAFFSNTPK